MAPGLQLPGDLGTEGGLHQDFLFPDPLPAGSVQRLLRIHAEVDIIHEYLHMALGLHVGPHYAEGPYRLAFLHEEARDDGVVSILARPQVIHMGRIHGEIKTAV